MEGINLVQFAGAVQDVKLVSENKALIRIAVYTSRYKDGLWEQIKCYPAVYSYGKVEQNSLNLKKGDLIHAFCHWQEEKDEDDAIFTEFVADKIVKLN